MCSLLIDEINIYDAKTKEQEDSLSDQKLEEGHTTIRKIRDYKKTSLLKPSNIFEEFVRGLEKERKADVQSKFDFFVLDFFLHIKSL